MKCRLQMQTRRGWRIELKNWHLWLGSWHLVRHSSPSKSCHQQLAFVAFALYQDIQQINVHSCKKILKLLQEFFLEDLTSSSRGIMAPFPTHIILDGGTTQTWGMAIIPTSFSSNSIDIILQDLTWDSSIHSKPNLTNHKVATQNQAWPNGWSRWQLAVFSSSREQKPTSRIYKHRLVSWL